MDDDTQVQDAPTDQTSGQQSEPVPHPVDDAIDALPAKQQEALLHMKDWVEQRVVNAGGSFDEFKAWVRREIMLARAGHSEETRVQQNP